MPSEVTQKHNPTPGQHTVPHHVKEPSASAGNPTVARPAVSLPPESTQRHAVPTSKLASLPAPAPPTVAEQRPRRPKPEAAPRTGWRWWVLGFSAVAVTTTMTCLALVAWLGIIYSSNEILPGVSAFGVELGGKTRAEAAAALEKEYQSGIILTDGDLTWRVDALALGITLDAEATADSAYQKSREPANLISALLGTIEVRPVVSVDLAAARAKLIDLQPQLEQPAINAGVQLVNGQVQPRPAQPGRVLDLESTLALLADDGAGVLQDGHLELVMSSVPPSVVDSSAMVQEASQLLTSPLEITAFDPIQNEKQVWTIAPETWSYWLVADAKDQAGLVLSLEPGLLRDYLSAQEQTLGTGRYLKLDEAIVNIQQTIAEKRTQSLIRIYHQPRPHTVRSGETFSSIAYEYGIPYPWIQAANPTVGDDLSVGQTLTIPSPDDLLPLPVVPHKRIVVSISQQRLWAYENEHLKWEWVVSTGIDSSPTAPGVFQIQSHETNAYAANWNLWMPHFMGVYRPVPTSDFMNGFHGFPTRGGSQLLWTNSLGTRVTYGCILLSNTNADVLYNWAEEGVVVEIQR
ncbi:MAG: L,D-transpeptidase family protein [Chloroflexi bacterium]|nr:L,D-transpeptidase family protein [Chloroflexota bacterium]